MNIFGRRNRIRLQQALMAVMLVFACVVEPLLNNDPTKTVISILGVLCIMVSAVGRTWCTYFIGTIKHQVLVQSGPYSLCRNPLYLFSLFGVAGFGLMQGSIIYTISFTAVWAGVILMLVSSEEQTLLEAFGEDYQRYYDSVPRILPLGKLSWKNTKIQQQVKSNNQFRHYLDSLLIPLLIPVSEAISYLQDIFGLTLWQVL